MQSGIVELLPKLVAIDSVNPSLVPGGAGEREIAAFVAAWARDRPAFPNYDAGTWGPASADDLIERDGRSWRRR